MDDEGAIRLRRVIIKVARQLNASSTGEGLTPSQASVLGLIVARGPMSLPDLGELEGINPTMLSRVIGRLVDMGLIDRIPDPADLRSVSVVSTAAGGRVDRQIKARRAAAVSQCLELLPAADVARAHRRAAGAGEPGRDHAPGQPRRSSVQPRPCPTAAGRAEPG